MTATLNTPSRTINVRVPEALYSKLDALANATARTKSYLTLSALSEYVDQQSWQIRDIEAGITEADRGEFATDAQVNAVFAKHGA